MAVSQSGLKAAVQTALDGLHAQFGSEHVRTIPDGQGGAWVEVTEQELGDVYEQDTTFLICLLPFNLPNADVYPAFVRHDLRRLDGAALGEGFQQTQVHLPGEATPRPVVQVSRRTRNGQFGNQTPAQKVEKVLAWIRTR
jgi:hypothetical protein